MLALDATLSHASAAVWADGVVTEAAADCGGRGQPSILPGLVQRALAEAGLATTDLTAVAVGIGPGGFSGLRAAASLAQGLGLGLGVPVHGVAARDALALGLAGRIGSFALWLALPGAGGRILLARPGAEPAAVEERALPPADGPVAVAGEAAIPVVARLVARGATAMLVGRVPVLAGDVTRLAAAALSGAAPASALRPPLPLYAEPPSVRAPG
ncbi:MAG: tRNA (adenosine(37)-N6)-threonylcarbamoyltransferase complex dimerization subunit type 1 TsaB [Acetobacteraceae bacterium]